MRVTARLADVRIRHLHAALQGARRGQRFLDTGELYWQFIGDGWGAPTRHAEILVALPKGVTKAQVRAWGHGPLNGSVTIRPGGSVFYSVSEVPPRDVHRGPHPVPGRGPRAGARRPADQLPVALAEEKRWADRANALRRRVIAEREAAARSRSVWRAVGVAAPAIIVLLLLVLTLTKGLGYRLGGRGETSMDIPDESSPALVAMLWKPRDFVRTAVPATLLDLVQRGVLALEPVPPGESGHDADKTGYRFRLTGQHAKDLRGHERVLVSLLFRDAVSEGPVSVARLREYAKEDPEQVGGRLRQFRREAIDEDRWGLLAEPVSFWVKTLRILAVPVGAISLFAAANGGSAWLLLGLPVAIAVAWVAPRWVRRPSDKGVEKYRAYRRLRNFMRAADGMDWKPPAAVVVWERYLVLAVVFGLADTVLKALALKAPEVVADPAFPAALWIGDAMGVSAWSSLNEGWGHVYSPGMLHAPSSSYSYAGPGMGGQARRDFPAASAGSPAASAAGAGSPAAVAEGRRRWRRRWRRRRRLRPPTRGRGRRAPSARAPATVTRTVTRRTSGVGDGVGVGLGMRYCFRSRIVLSERMLWNLARPGSTEVEDVEEVAVAEAGRTVEVQPGDVPGAGEARAAGLVARDRSAQRGPDDRQVPGQVHQRDAQVPALAGADDLLRACRAPRCSRRGTPDSGPTASTTRSSAWWSSSGCACWSRRAARSAPRASAGAA